MANRCKGEILLAALIFTSSCSRSAGSLPPPADTLKQTILDFANTFAMNRITYNQYVAHEAPFKPTKKLLFNGDNVNAFDYGVLGQCFGIDNRYLYDGKDPNKRPVQDFECLMDKKDFKLVDLADFLGEIRFGRIIIEQFEPLASIEAISLPAGYQAYSFVFERSPASGFWIEAIVISDNDIVKVAQKAGSYPVLSDDAMKHLSSHTIVKRIRFHKILIY